MINLLLIFLILTGFSFANEDLDKKIEQAWQLYEKGNFIKMERLSKEILNKSLQINYLKGIAEGYYYLGVAYFSMGNTQKALDYANKALEFANSHDNFKWKVYSYTLVGEILRNLRKYSEALSYFQKALEIAKENKDEKLLPGAFANLGNIYFDKKEYKKAIEYYQKGLEAGKKVKIRKSYIALNHYNLGISFYRIRNWDETIKHLSIAYRIYVELGDKKSVVSSAYYLAKSYYKKGDKEKALQILKENKNMAKQVLALRSYKRLIKKIEEMN